MFPAVGRGRAVPAPRLRVVRQLQRRVDHLGRGGDHRTDRGDGGAPVRHGTPVPPPSTVDGEIVHTLTGLGYVSAVVLMAVFVVVNYFGIRWFARINNALVGWKIFIILLVIAAFLVSAFHGENFTSHGFKPEGLARVFTAIATSGIVFSYSASARIEARGRDRQPAPQRTRSRSWDRWCSHRPDLHRPPGGVHRGTPRA